MVNVGYLRRVFIECLIDGKHPSRQLCELIKDDGIPMPLHVCQKMGLEPGTTYSTALRQYLGWKSREEMRKERVPY